MTETALPWYSKLWVWLKGLVHPEHGTRHYRQPQSLRAVWLAMLSSAAWVVLSLVAIISVWGPIEKLQAATATATKPTTTTIQQATFKFLWWHATGSADLGLFWVALAAGTLAGAAHCFYVLAGAVPHGNVPIGRLGWFLPQPILAGVLGSLTFVVVRAGLVSGESSSGAVSLFGALAIGGIAGISAPAAFKRLTKLGTGTSDPPEGGGAPTIKSVNPATVSRAHPPTSLAVLGSNLDGCTYTINTVSVAPTSPSSTGATLLMTNVDVSVAKLTITATSASNGSASKDVTVTA